MEKFYYPLLNFLKHNINIVPSNDELHVRADVYNIDNRKSDSYYKDFIMHQYLSTKEVKDELKKFLEIISHSKITKEREDIDVYNKLIKYVEIDIENLSKDLNDLVEPHFSHFELIILILFLMLFYFIFMFSFISSNISTILY